MRLSVFGVLAVLVLSQGALACRRERPAPAGEATADGKTMNIYSLSTKTLEGQEQSLDRFGGKVTLLVNVASYCGKTPQYTGLEQLQQKYQPRGFSVLGFPSNDFGKQEPGSAEEIREFCTKKYAVTFPLFEKVQTKAGPGQS
ncbi:MAG TPA: glutathione peroxidase, partial [Polyangiaceae bacterium]